MEPVRAPCTVYKLSRSESRRLRRDFFCADSPVVVELYPIRRAKQFHPPTIPGADLILSLALASLILAWALLMWEALVFAGWGVWALWWGVI